jgi:spore coat protein CotF
MMKIISDLIKDSANVDDKVISESMMAAAKGGALLYINSALTSTTPELRAIYSASAAHMMEGDAALTELYIKRQWVKPYEAPISMLNCTVDCAKNTVDNKD